MVATGRGRWGVWAGLIALFAFGCASAPRQLTLDDLHQRGTAAGLEVQRLSGELFTLVALAPPQARSKVLRIYIEGDGLAWRTRYRLSAHPSPVTPTALNLMLVDPTSDKAYLARPCQYLQTEACHPKYWSTDLFSEEVISGMSRALDALKDRGGYTHLELVGYSGGGGVAVLLSARRDDITGLMTVAGNLDTEAVCRLHGLTPLSASLNPADVAEGLCGISQHHFMGKEDKIIPVSIYTSFAAHLSSIQAVSSVVVDDVTHQRGWEEQWAGLLQEYGLAPFRAQPTNERNYSVQ